MAWPPPGPIDRLHALIFIRPPKDPIKENPNMSIRTDLINCLKNQYRFDVEDINVVLDACSLEEIAVERDFQVTVSLTLNVSCVDLQGQDPDALTSSDAEDLVNDFLGDAVTDIVERKLSDTFDGVNAYIDDCEVD